MELKLFAAEAKPLQDELIKTRRKLHGNPELGCDTPQTAALVRSQLEAMGYAVTGCGKNGLVALAGGKRPGKCFMIRADMDALPVTEDTGLEFAAANGRMHACGHDFHTTMLLGAAKLLKAHEDEIPGTVKLMFQPGEETLEGAKMMVEHGVLDNPKVDAAAMFHVAAGYPVPTGLMLVPNGGPFTSASDSLKLTIHGKGGHGAMPENCVDPVVVASHTVLALQEIVSREVSPLETAVITVGVLRAGEAGNVIPDTAELVGTIRSYSPAVRALLHKRIQEVCDGVSAVFRAKADTDVIPGCPSVLVDGGVSAVLRGALGSVFGPLVPPPEATGITRLGGSEDFGHVTEKVPSVMMILCAGNPEEGYAYGQHHPKAKFNEAVLWQGAAAYAIAAVGWLQAHGS